jgi:hypothetical protein
MLVIGSNILCSTLSLQDILFFNASFSILVYCIEKLPSASIKPANHLFLFKDSNLTGNLLIFKLWFLFNQSIKR